MIEIPLLMLLITVIIGLIFSYLAIIEKDLLKAIGFSAIQAIAYAIAFYILMAPDIIEKDLLKAIGFSAIQAIAYAIAFYILMAPDIVLAYVAVAVGIYSALLIFVVSKSCWYLFRTVDLCGE